MIFDLIDNLFSICLLKQRHFKKNGRLKMNLLNQSKFKFPLLLFIFLVVFVACVHPISEGIRAQIDPTLTFNQILESPDPHLNQPVMYGGVIVKTKSFDNSECNQRK